MPRGKDLKPRKNRGKATELTRRRMSEAHRQWYADGGVNGMKGKVPSSIKANPGYSALHKWVKYHLGSPSVCEYCGFTSDNPYRLHWANKSHRYLRDKSDWLRLCVSCHKAYDLKFKS